MVKEKQRLLKQSVVRNPVDLNPKICFARYLGIYLQVQLPHSRNNGLFALIIKMDSKSGIFPGKAVQAL